MTQSDPIVIVSAARTAIGHFNGFFSNTAATELGAAAIRANVERAQLDPNKVDDVIMGCVLPAGLGQAPARQAALAAGLNPHTACTTINKMCGSGMKAIMLAHDAIVAGTNQISIAGGLENMTQAPYLLEKARNGYRLGHGKIYDHMMLDGLEDAYNPGQAMGCFAELCADKYHFTRAQQDEFAQQSYQRAKQAADSGAFEAEITPVEVRSRKTTEVIAHDEGPIKINPEKIPNLKPAFKKDGTVTAANSSSISDGAAAVMLMRKSTAEQHGLTPLATIVAHHTHAQQPEWFTTAPVNAISGLLKNIGWQVDDVDLFEINEAFAVVTMAAIKELNLDPDKVNLHGGACVLGHPIGASGARILITLLHAMQQREVTRGVAALCIGGGEATAIAIQR